MLFTSTSILLHLVIYVWQLGKVLPQNYGMLPNYGPGYIPQNEGPVYMQPIVRSYYNYPELYSPDNLEVTNESPGSGDIDDGDLHSIEGKFLLLPSENSNIFENFDTDLTERKLDEPHYKAQITYASDGTKIIQHDPTEIPTTAPTSPPTTKGTTKSPAELMRTPKVNSTKIKWAKDGTRITQFNTGIKENEGTIEPSFQYIANEYVPGFSDEDEKNAAGYKLRNREGEILNETSGSGITDDTDKKITKHNHSKGKVSIRVVNLRPFKLGNAKTGNRRGYGFFPQPKTTQLKLRTKISQIKQNNLSNLLAESVAKKEQNASLAFSNLRIKPPTYYKLPKFQSGRHHYNKVYNFFGRNKTLTGVNSTLPAKSSTSLGKNVTLLQTNASSSLSNVTNKQTSSAKLSQALEAFETTSPTEDSVGEKKNKEEFSSQKLQEVLRKVQFKNQVGEIHHGQEFAYISQCGLYTEPQNVSVVQHAWVTKTYSPYFYLYEKPKDYEKCKPGPWMNGTDMRGSVFISFEVKSMHGSNMENNAKICQKYCCKEARCSAWVLRKQPDATANCPKDSFCCWLKSAIPKLEQHEDCISGIVHRESYRHPPSGMRSAVPLGGLGTGSFEIRADGTFHEWTIENQSPGGSAKLGKTALDMTLLGLRVKRGKKARSAAIRTHAPHGFNSIEKIAYKGSYPYSKFDLEMQKVKDLNITLYAYSVLHPRDPVSSATPAVAFSLDVTNTGTDVANVSLFLNVPFGYNDDTIRRGGNYAEVAFTRLVSATDCQRACAKQAKCLSWTTNGPYSCMLKDTIPMHSYEFGIISGIKGDWTIQDSMLNCKRPGTLSQSGDITLFPIEEGSTKASFVTTDDVEKTWKNFEKTGELSNGTINITALNGAVSLTKSLQPGESGLLTIIMAWHFPNRDLTDERIGNYYNNLYPSSKEVAKHMKDDLINSTQSIINMQKAIITPKSAFTPKKGHKSEKSCEPYRDGLYTLPECLQDILLNSLSFFRSGMWMENGRWRQWEALDCVNMDPVHVDLHRVIPYMILYPGLAKNVMYAWADHQLINGMIQESLSTGCLDETAREGTAGGRSMADVNAGFIAQAYLIYIWTNDTEFFQKIYPAAKRATEWLIKDSTHGTGLPYRKPDTYDLFDLDKFDHCAYNSIVFLLAMRTAQEMAKLQRDDVMLADTTAAIDKARLLLDIEMWDEKEMFYHAWFDAEWGSPSWLMSDTFYGQVWAYTLGLGDLIDREKIKRHLLRERERNDSPYGLKVISKSDSPLINPEDTSLILGDEGGGCKSLENITKYESVWMSASTDWSTLEVHLGMKPKMALHQAEKSLDHYRSTLRDQWNFHGLTSSDAYGVDGLPWATSHYTLHLVLWHLPLALSGQQYFAPNGSLTFDPKFNLPYWLPFYTPQAMGNIEGKEVTVQKKKEVQFKLTVTSGNLRLHHLAISGVSYTNSLVEVKEGESVTWSSRITKKDEVSYFLSQLKHR